jgi:hypothetical protein
MRNRAGLMCRVLFLCAASLLSVRLLAGQEKQDDKSVLQTENEVLKVGQAGDHALQQRDVALLDRIYSDQIAFVNTGGQKFTKGSAWPISGPGKLNTFPTTRKASPTMCTAIRS